MSWPRAPCCGRYQTDQTAMIKHLTFLCGTLLLVSCAATSQFAPVNTDQQLYRMSAEGRWLERSGGQLKGALYRQAGAFCRERGQSAVPMQDDYRDGGWFSRAYAEIEFRCVADNSQELGRPAFWGGSPTSDQD